MLQVKCFYSRIAAMLLSISARDVIIRIKFFMARRRRMMRWVVIGVCCLVMGGCAYRWESSTKRPSEFYADDRECQVVAGGASQGLTPGDDRTSYESCMWERGWRKKQSIWFFDPDGN
jgi:hypothetical protein